MNNIREVFNNQWHDIQNVVLSDVLQQIKRSSKVSTKELTDKLGQETRKWQKGVLGRGVFYAGIAKQNPIKAQLFAEAAEQFKFTELKYSRIPSLWWLKVVCLIPVIIFAAILHKYTELNWIEQLVYPSLSFVFLNAFCMPFKMKMQDKCIHEIIAEVKEQMQEMKSMLEQYL